MGSHHSQRKPLVFLISIFLTLTLLRHVSAQDSPEKCGSGDGTCRDRAGSLNLKLIAMASILAASFAGIAAPLLTKSVPAVKPGSSAFMIIKGFASGVILATGYMHVLPDSFDCFASPCLPENPWRRFPFAAFVAMLSAVATLMVDSVSMSLHRRKIPRDQRDNYDAENNNHNHNNVIINSNDNNTDDKDQCDGKGKALDLLRYRVVAQVLELGIVVHSVVIGLSLGASDNPCTIRPLIAALCFHQLFEGMGLGGCILQAEYGMKVKAIMVFFFAFTTPFGIALGIGLSNIYSDDSPTALIVVGLLNACSAGLLNYMALVELLAADFLGPHLQANMKLQFWSYVSVLLGAGGMALMAKWA